MREIIQKGSSIGWGVEELVDVAQDRDKWRVLVNTVMNRQVPKKCEEFLQ
jgi:hypothetical protein